MEIITNQDEINNINNRLFINLNSELNETLELKLKYNDFKRQFNNFYSSVVYYNDHDNIWFAVDKNKNKIRYYFGTKNQIKTEHNTEANFVFYIDTFKIMNSSVFFAKEKENYYLLIKLLSSSKIKQLEKIGFKIENIFVDNSIGNINFFVIPIDKNIINIIQKLIYSVKIKFYSHKGILIDKVLIKKSDNIPIVKKINSNENKFCEICGNNIISINQKNKMLKELMTFNCDTCNICLEKIAALYAFKILNEHLKNDYELFDNLNAQVNNINLFEFYILLLKKYELISDNNKILFLKDREDLMKKFLPFISKIPKEFELSFNS